ncbi:MAG: ornithine cyclodeaminase family protein [Lautropia sp.]
MRLLNAADLRELIALPACIEAMRRVFIDLAEGRLFVPLRGRAMPDGSPNWITWMPALRTGAPRRWALKEMVVTPDNSARRGLDPIQGIVVLHDGDDGRILAIADAPTLTELRTAAVTALATATFAPPDPRVVAILGTGVQGRQHIAALRCVLSAATIRIWGRDPEATARLAADTGCVAAPDIRHALADADVVCTVTAATTPVLRREWLKPGCHLNAVGSSRPVARELDAATVAAAALFVDRREAALTEAGEIVAALQEGAITPAHIRAELGEVLTGRLPGRTSADQFTLYKSLGLAALDLAALELAWQAAEQSGRGTVVDW